MKNAIIGALLILIALLTFGARDHSGAQAVIQDTTVHHAAVKPEQAPMLLLPCPLSPRNFPHANSDRKA